MASIATIILDPTVAIDAWDFDPAVGTGASMDEIDAPADFTSAAFTFDPFVI